MAGDLARLRRVARSTPWGIRLVGWLAGKAQSIVDRIDSDIRQSVWSVRSFLTLVDPEAVRSLCVSFTAEKDVLSVRTP